MTNASLGWTQNQEFKCAKCGKTTEFKSVDFAEVCGDVRLNFVKITCCDHFTCPHCGGEMEVDAAWWQRVFPYKAENGETFYRVVPFWFEDNSEGCSSDNLSKPVTYASNTYDFDDLRLDFDGANELVERLYSRTKDPALHSIKEVLKEKSELYNKMTKVTNDEQELSEKFGMESIEAVIPELKRIIDSHDDMLKDPYMPNFNH